MEVLKLFVFFIFFFVTFSDSTAKLSPTVEIWQGKLQGRVDVSFGKHEYYSFLGIPYAKPPVGELRFQVPKEAAKWNRTLKAVTAGPQCYNFFSVTPIANEKSNEDCLFVNVYTKKIPDSVNTEPGLPVMVWIHGGGLQFGSADPEIYGADYLLDQDIVLVSMNYRLGIIGFLSTGDSSCPGNMGLKDQVLALKWVQKNIAAFGGDPNKVTIFGESAGGAAVHYHMLSPMSKGLFSRAISQSGVAHCPWAFMSPHIVPKNLKLIGEQTNCPTEDTKEFVRCLQEVDPMDLVNVNVKKYPYHSVFASAPTIELEGDEKFLSDYPVVLMKKGKFADVPWLLGFNKNEGAYRVSVMWQKPEFVKQLNQSFPLIGPYMLRLHELFDTPEEEQIMAEKIREFYYGDEPITDENAHQFIDLYTDRWFSSHIQTGVDIHRGKSNSPIYLYELTHRGVTSLTEALTKSKRDFGVSHVDDIQYLFHGNTFLTSLYDLNKSHNDIQLSKLMTTMWAEFARTGNPTPDDNTDLPIHWDPITKNSNDISYLNLNPNPTMEKGFPHSERMEFWKKNPLPESGWEVKLSTKDEL